MRRSNRLKAKKPGMSTAMMMLCIFAIIAPMNAVIHKERVQSGLAYFFKREVLAKIGTHNVEITTNMKPERNIMVVTEQIIHYRKTCQRVEYDGVHQLYELDVFLNYTKNTDHQ